MEGLKAEAKGLAVTETVDQVAVRRVNTRGDVSARHVSVLLSVVQ